MSKYCNNCGFRFADGENVVTINQRLASSSASSSSPLSHLNRAKEQNINTFVTCKLPAYGVKIDYPSNWSRIEPSLKGRTIVLFQSPRENPSDAFLEAVGIVLITSGNMKLEQFIQVVINNLKNKHHDFSLIESVPTTLAGQQAHKLVYNRNGRIHMLTSTVKGGKAYSIHYIAEPTKYNSYLSIVQKMIDSFEITKATETVLKQAEPLAKDAARELRLERGFRTFTHQRDVMDRIKERESSNVELKSSFRYDIKLKQPNPTKLLEKMVAKTIAAFMNSKDGGTLFIGVDDEGNVLGLQDDYKTLKKQNSDGFEIELRQSIEKFTKNKIANENILVNFHCIDGKEICEIIVSPASEPVVIYGEGKQQEFYVRVGNSSKPYSWHEFYEYSKRRFK